MQLAVVAAGFSPGEADQLRRAMAAWRRKGGLGSFEERLRQGMQARGYSAAFARQIFQQIQGFGEYGFPESHSASFALLVYVSAWLKCHEPAAFTCALLNSQPMGFYAPAQLIQDARRHGVKVCPVDVRYSHWDCTLEPGSQEEPAIRLGLRMVKGLLQVVAERLVSARADTPYRSVGDLARRAILPRREMGLLAGAGALAGIAGNRYQARWRILGIESRPGLFENATFSEGAPMLPVPTEGQELLADYANLGFTLGRHPLALLRGRLAEEGMLTAAGVRMLGHGDDARAGGLVINRQRPLTASGVIFVTLEDETGFINVVVRPRVAEKQRQVLLGARLMCVNGSLEREGDVVHLVAVRLEDHSALLGRLQARSRDFH